MDLQKPADNMAFNAAATVLLPDLPVPDKGKTKNYAYACAILASISSILLGYDIGVMSGAVIYIQKDLKISDVEVEILVGILNLYCLFGSAAAGKTSDWIGRRYTISLAAAIFFVGAILMGTAVSYGLLMLGRYVAGIGVGYALMIAPVYTAEVSPSSARGFLTSFPEVFINFGILLGYVSNLAFSRLNLQLGWRLMLGIGAVPAIFMGLGVIVMPESPRWLVLQGRIGDARRVLLKTSNTKEEALCRLLDIQEAAGIPLDCTEEVVKVPKVKKGHQVWKELFLHPTPNVRRVLVAVIGIHFFQQASGIDAVVLYSPRIFKIAGIKNDSAVLGATVAVGFVKTITILIATFNLDKVGRRPLLLTSVALMITTLVLLASALTIIHHQHPDKKIMWAIILCITMMLAYVAAFSIGLGPVTWVYSSEIFPLRLRAQGTSVGVAVNRVVSGVVSMTFLSMSKVMPIGGGFFLFAGVASIAWVFFFTCLPETRGRNLEDMDSLFRKAKDGKKTCLPETRGRNLEDMDSLFRKAKDGKKGDRN